MSRELKFRQPVFENGKFVRWHYWGFRDGLYQHPTNQHTSDEFTGSFDYNGKEIYEGDIIEWSIFPDDEPVCRIVDTVQYSNGCFSVARRHELLFMKAPHNEVAVVGNTHYNQELIENL